MRSFAHRIHLQAAGVSAAELGALSAMNSENVKILADAVKEYFSQYELEDMCRQLNIDLNYSGTSPNLQRLAGDLLTNSHSDRNRRLLKTLLTALLKRCHEQIQNATREDNLYHKQMSLQLRQLNQFLSTDKPVAVAPKASPFPPVSTRSNLVDFFSRAKTVVTLTDSNLGAGTLDCLRKVEQPIRLLTADAVEGFDKNFIQALKYFRDRSRTLELRWHGSLHDRVVFFNNRCWLASGPLKDAVHESFKMIEVVDSRDAIAGTLERKWQEAEIIIIG